MTIIKTRVYAAPGCHGQYEELRRRNGHFETRTIKLFTRGPREVMEWERVAGFTEACRIINWSDDRIPASWLDAIDKYRRSI